MAHQGVAIVEPFGMGLMTISEWQLLGLWPRTIGPLAAIGH